jgi:hypothetical protein
MRTATLAVTAFVAIALSVSGFVAVAQTTRPADPGMTSGKAKDRRDANKDGVVSADEKSDARRKSQERFKAADKNNDGALTREEAKAGGYASIEKNFDAMDTDKDGKVTREERRAYAKARKGEKSSATGSSRKSEGGLQPPR